MKIWEHKPPGTLWATPGLLLDDFTFYYYYVGVVIFVVLVVAFSYVSIFFSV
jgi:hypothetical protein